MKTGDVLDSTEDTATRLRRLEPLSDQLVLQTHLRETVGLGGDVDVQFMLQGITSLFE